MKKKKLIKQAKCVTDSLGLNMNGDLENHELEDIVDDLNILAGLLRTIQYYNIDSDYKQAVREIFR